jgi:hypothetical protein
MNIKKEGVGHIVSLVACGDSASQKCKDACDGIDQEIEICRAACDEIK